jgi:hypothetical protein
VAAVPQHHSCLSRIQGQFDAAVHLRALAAAKKSTLAQIAAALPASTTQYLTSGTSATYTTPANCRAIRVRMVGGGGGGAYFSGGGGGAGEYVELFISSPAATYAYTVGAGGTAGSGGTNGVVLAGLA